MAEKKIKTVPITLDRERLLGYNFNSVAALEKACGHSPFSEEFWAGMGPIKLRLLVWAGLLHEEPALTLEQVGEWMVPSEVGAYTQAVIQAWNDNNAAPKDEEPAAPPEPAA